jgi:uncharacterized protein (DUF1499 family)
MKRRLMKVLVGLIVISTAFVVYLAVLAASSRRSGWPIGLVDGRLRSAVVGKPNNVSSLASDAEHRVEPLRVDGLGGSVVSAESAMDRVAAVLTAIAGTKIVERTPTYLRAESTSTFFGFVDDFEALWDAENRVIQVRAGSRVGHSDLGVNRARIERIRKALTARP